MFQFFPGNYMWSQAIMRALGSGGAIGEVIKVVSALQDAAPRYDAEAWYDAWHALGDHLWQQGEIDLQDVSFAQVFVAAPFYVRAARSGFLAVPPEL